MEITSTHSARGGFLYNFSTLVSVGKSDINWHDLLLTEISGLGETASQSIHHFFAGFTSVIWGVFQTWDWNLTVKIWDLVPKDLGFDTWNFIWHHCWKQNGKLWCVHTDIMLSTKQLERDENTPLDFFHPSRMTLQNRFLLLCCSFSIYIYFCF